MSVEPIGKQVAAALLVRAWDAVSPAVLDEASALNEEVEENEE
jgi:putative cell wall-binding protein